MDRETPPVEEASRGDAEKAMIDWKTPSSKLPAQGQLCLIIVNFTIIADVVVFRENGFHNNGHFIDLNQVQYWAGKNEIPCPEAIKSEMIERQADGEKTIELAARYKATQEKDLFGKFEDPDDVDRSFDVVST
jgi:hypothetical protein